MKSKNVFSNKTICLSIVLVTVLVVIGFNSFYYSSVDDIPDPTKETISEFEANNIIITNEDGNLEFDSNENNDDNTEQSNDDDETDKKTEIELLEEERESIKHEMEVIDAKIANIIETENHNLVD